MVADSPWIPPADAREFAGGKLLVDEPAADVARLTIVNPEKRNALDHAILAAFATALGDLEARCVLVTGSHGMFSAGYDLGGMPENRFSEEAEKLVAHPFTDAIDALELYPYPVVAALSGHTIGGGLELALSCDLRIGQEGIKLGMPPAKLGLVYSHTGLQRFISAIGAPRTRELFIVGRNISVDRALNWGLVNDVAPAAELQDRAIALAAEIAANAPLSTSGNKRVIRDLLAQRDVLDPAVEAELVELRRACFLSDDFREGVQAFGEKRKPQWRGR